MTPSRRTLLQLAALAGLMAIAALALAATDGAQATITGKPLPSPGSDWVIDNDTFVFAEDIFLSGSIIVVPGHSLDVLNSTITINSTTPGQKGINVQANLTASGHLDVSATNVLSAATDKGYTFVIDGNASLYGSSFAYVHNGIRIRNDPVDIDLCMVYATGTHGIYVEGASPRISTTGINLSVATTGTGLEVRGTTTRPASPVLSGLEVLVDANTTVSSSLTTVTAAFSITGLRSVGASLGTLSSILVYLGEQLNATLTSNSNSKLTLTFAAVGISLEGGTAVDGFDLVYITGVGFGASVSYTGTSSASVAATSNLIGLKNSIDATGQSPVDISGITMSDLSASYTTTGTFSTSTLTVTGIGLQWDADAASTGGDSLNFDGLELWRLQVDLLIKVTDMWDVTFTDLIAGGCTMSTGLMRLDAWTHSMTLEGLLADSNVVKAQTGDLIYALKMAGPLTLSLSTVSNNLLARALFMDGPIGDVTVNGNTFMGNNHTQSLVVISGPGVLGAGGLIANDNSFVDNVCTGPTLALLLVEHPKVDLHMAGNSFSNDTASGIVVMTPYTDATLLPTPSFTFALQDNTFDGLKGDAMSLMNVDNSNIVITANRATGCGMRGLVVDQTATVLTTTKSWATFKNYIQGPDSISVSNNELNENAGGGAYIRTSMWDPKNPTVTGNPYQTVEVIDNVLMYDGTGPSEGWALYLTGLYSRPTVSGNQMDGSCNGQYMEIISDVNSRSPFLLSYDGFHIDGMGFGRIAYGFSGIGATFLNCTFVNYSTVVSVVDADVNLLWCDVPVGSGTSLGGAVAAYNHLEIAVEWASATGARSGVPAAGATVSLTASNGLALKAMEADTSGRTPVTIVKVWENVDGELYMASPIKVSLVSNGESDEYYFDLTGERVGAAVVRLLLLDRDVPALTVSSPIDGSVLSAGSVTLSGVLVDYGSGIVAFEARHDGMPADQWVDIKPAALWSRAFSGLADGAHTFTVRARDVAGNANSTDLSFTVDTAPPALQATVTFLDSAPIPFDAAQGSYFTPTTPIQLVGNFSDLVAPLDMVIIRLGGEVLTQLGGQPGQINLRVALVEGVNLLLVDATDPAGNRASVTIKVTLDSSQPILYVYAPLDGTETGTASMAVRGLTEPGLLMKVVLESVQGTRTYDTVDTPSGPVPLESAADGTFEVTVVPFEGTQVMIVSATDTAGNVGQVELSVTLDTQTPEFVITSPSASLTVTRSATWTVEGMMTKESTAAVTINGQAVANPGTFSYPVVLQEGTNEVEVIAKDKVGNTFSQSFTIVKDTVAPIMTVVTPSGADVLTREATVTFSGSISGAAAAYGGEGGVFIDVKGVEHAATLASGTWGEGTWEYVLQLAPQDLEQVVTVTARDEAGNEVVRTFTIRYDVIPPSLHIDALPATTSAPTIDINGSTDEDVGTVYVNGMAFPVTNGLFKVVWPLSSGANTITVRVQDLAGNVQTDTSTVTLQWPAPPKEPTTEEEEGTAGPGVALPAGLIVAGLVAVVVAFVLAARGKGGDAR